MNLTEMEIRLKSSLLVSAEIRRCEGLFLNSVILHKGDDERGLILIKQFVGGKGARIFAQTRDDDDDVLVWHQPLGKNWLEETKADQYIARQRKFDEDLWVIEIDDPKNVYTP